MKRGCHSVSQTFHVPGSALNFPIFLPEREGRLTGSISRACDSSSQGREGLPRDG